MNKKRECLIGIFFTILALIMLISLLFFIKKDNFILGTIISKKNEMNYKKTILKPEKNFNIKNEYKNIENIESINLKYFFEIKKEQTLLSKNLIEIKNNKNYIINNLINVKIKLKKESILFFLYKTIFYF